MQSYIYNSKSENDTKKIAFKMASMLKKGDLIVLCGDLGSGKTKFTEGFLTYFGLEDSSEFYAIGGDEYFENGICLVEWGELIQDALPNEYIKINFSRDESYENERVLNIQSIGKKYDNIIESLKGE